jgi:hypothetical protein
MLLLLSPMFLLFLSMLFDLPLVLFFLLSMLLDLGAMCGNNEE